MGAVIKFIGVFSTAAAIGVTLKSLDGFFEWTDTRRAAKLEASEMKQAIYLDEQDEWSVTKCGHHYHTTCLETSLTHGRNCPLCRKKVAAKKGEGYFRLFLNFAPHGAGTPQSAVQAARPRSDLVDLLQTAQIEALTDERDGCVAHNQSLQKELRATQESLHALERSHKSSKEAAKKALKEQATVLHQQLQQAREDHMRAEGKLKDVKALTYKLTFENKALSLKTETHASKDEIRRLAQNMQPAGGKGQVDERAQGCVVEKFAEVLAVRNKEYNALVQSAKAAAAKAHSEGSQLKGELESLRSQIRQLKSKIEDLEGKLQGQPATLLTKPPSHISWETQDHELDFLGPVRAGGAPRRVQPPLGGRQPPPLAFGRQPQPPQKRSRFEGGSGMPSKEVAGTDAPAAELTESGPGLDDLAGAAWESSQEDGDECGSGHDTAAVAVVGAPLCKESASRRGHLTDGRAPADQVEKAHAAADYDSDATQCSDEGDIADEAGGRQTAACPVNPGDRIQAGAGIDASHYRDGTGMAAGASRETPRLSTPAASSKAAPQLPAWRSRPPSPSDLSLGPAAVVHRLTDRPPATLPPPSHRSPALRPPAGNGPRQRSKVGQKRVLKRAYAEEDESWENGLEEAGMIDLLGEAEDGAGTSGADCFSGEDAEGTIELVDDGYWGLDDYDLPSDLLNPGRPPGGGSGGHGAPAGARFILQGADGRGGRTTVLQPSLNSNSGLGLPSGMAGQSGFRKPFQNATLYSKGKKKASGQGENLKISNYFSKRN